MIVHRFMSDKEYQALIAGEILTNTTVHANNGKKSTSVGFCFFTEAPEEAIHWMSFNVSVDWCVTFDIPRQLLTKSRGRYRDPEKDSWDLPEPAAIWRTEYCLQSYSIQTARIINATDKWKGYEEAMIGQVLAFFGQALFGRQPN
jgi:hypothetical protein